MPQYLTVVYTINDEDAFMPTLRGIVESMKTLTANRSRSPMPRVTMSFNAWSGSERRLIAVTHTLLRRLLISMVLAMSSRWMILRSRGGKLWKNQS